ncbi:MAG: hypothetical protein M3O25_09350 [Actinomycetota bacterium]|nr:hypothetical protein [Actinomycetota bacterium]
MLGIFIYGCFVFAIVATAIGLITWGIHAERHDRELLGAELAAQPGTQSMASRAAGDAHVPTA